VPRKSPSAARRSEGRLTARQTEVLALIARGLTTKEIAHSLGITERGVAAQVSRLLARFNVPNRAGLIARTLSDAIAGSTSTTGPADPVNFTAEIQNQLEAYRTSAFSIGLTIGADNLVVWNNDAGRRMFDIQPESRTDALYAARRTSDSTDVGRIAAERAFRTGLPTTIETTNVRWLKDDGSWATVSLSCVLQPVRADTGGVIGILWICAPTTAS
jgi:DNA-binding CsgD family transcriptional regulator